jgi:hypothetical protein
MPTEQYEAVLYAVKEVPSVGFFDNRDRAQSWIMKEYEKIIGENLLQRSTITNNIDKRYL